MKRVIDRTCIAVTFLGGTILALICIFDVGPQFRAVRSLSAALLIGACVSYTLLVKPGGSGQFRKPVVAVFAAALVGTSAAMIYFVVILAILSIRDSVEVIISRSSTLLMLKLALSLTLFSSAGGLVITAIVKLLRPRRKRFL
jgi:hypothetical protein